MSRIERSLLVLAAVLLTSPVPGIFRGDTPQCGAGADPASVAATCPDVFAWRLFAQVNAPVAEGLATFQTWSSDADSFPCAPADAATCRVDPAAPGCPMWPAAEGAALPPGRTAGAVAGASAAQPREVVYRNRPAFDYIVEHGLWYAEGVEKAVEEGLVFDLPGDAVEVKTRWIPLSPAEVASGRYYTAELGGAPYGLVAMHLSSKVLPSWFRATFEHVDSPGRCDFLGCHDSFGVVPRDVPPHLATPGEPYPAGTLTGPVERLLKGLPPVYRRYRLKASTVDYTDVTGFPRLLGDPVAEAGLVRSSSCATCHGQATFQGEGGPPAAERLAPGVAALRGDGWRARLEASDADPVWALPFAVSALRTTSAGGCRCETASCQPG